MKCGVQQIITIICVTYVPKDFKIQTVIKQLLTTYQIFTKLPQIYFFIFASCESIIKARFGQLGENGNCIQAGVPNPGEGGTHIGKWYGNVPQS